tara:strand:+ start:45917 stop:46732 length:816 start_codon:yes stop_codon:yes gene_type:complete
MKFVIQKFLKDDAQSRMAKEIEKRGHELIWATGADNVELSRNIIDKCFGNPSDIPLVVFGSIQFVKRCQVKFNSFPIAWINDTDDYKCSSYYSGLEEHLFNDKHAYFTVSSLPYLKFDIYKWFGKDTMIFMRPDSGEKPFTAGLFDMQDFDKDYNGWIKEGCLPTDLVLVSTPKNIVSEHRFVCGFKQDIITYSTYQFQGNTTIVPSAPSEAVKKCKEVLTCIEPPDKIFILDIAQDGDGNFWLMEMNSFNSAGLYACDVGKVLDWIEKNA